MKNNVLDGIMGLCVADALGVPVEFLSREKLRMNPVFDMRGFGTHGQPAGTWSDDTSMTLCLLDSLVKGLDYYDIMSKFFEWFDEGKYTPFGEVFDIGISTRKAINRFLDGTKPLKCGGLGEHDNGNGSLMRILPVLFYVQSVYGKDFDQSDDAFSIIHNVSSLTHAHKRSKISCGIYLSVATMLSEKMDLKMAVDTGIFKATEYYNKHSEFKDELSHFVRLFEKDFDKLDEKMIKSSGYVVDTLEASIWCLLNSKTYKECVLKAVNLGEDTDTVAAVAGGLAGLYYGYDNIPDEWITAIIKREYIESICNKLNIKLSRNYIEKLSLFIPYFENASKDSVCNWIGGENLGKNQFTMQYPLYEPKIDEFIQEVYKSNLLIGDYHDVIKKQGLEGIKQITQAIDDADFELVTAILTWVVRGERFCDGLWGSAVEDKTFLKIINRLNRLILEI